jgi:hypothetical protein
MQGPGDPGFYPQPVYPTYSNPRAYVQDLHQRVAGQINAQYQVQIPDYVAGTTSFALPGFANLQLSFPTSPNTAASLFRRIDRAIQFRNQFRQFINQFRVPGTTVALPQVISNPLGLEVPLPQVSGQFASATISVVLFTWQGDNEVRLYATVTATPDELRTLLESDDGQDNVENLWTNNWENQANLNLGSAGFVERMYLTNVISVDYSNQSWAYNVTTAMNNLSNRLKPPAPPPRQTRSMARAARMSSVPLTRSRARALGVRLRGSGADIQVRNGHDRTDDSELYEVDPMRNAMFGLRPDALDDANQARFRDVNAPVITNTMLQPVSLDDFRRHRFDSSENYQSTYLRTMSKEKRRNMCWFAAVCDLVNHATGSMVMTFELLLEHLNYNRMGMGFVPHSMLTIQEQGLSIDDMDCIFKAFERRTIIYNVAGELVYEYGGNRNKRRNIKPTTWCFIVGYGHVYPVHGYDHRSFQRMQQARHDVFARQNETEEGEEPPKPLTFMFPAALRCMPADVRLTQTSTKEIDRLTHVLLRDTSLFQLLMQPRDEWKGSKLVVLVDARTSLEEIYMRMVHEFHHRPEVYFMRHYVAMLDASSHGFYRRIVFKNMSYLNTENEPDMITEPSQYLRFKEYSYELRKVLYHTSLLSFVNEDAHTVMATFPRTPYVGFMPDWDMDSARAHAPFAGLDFNRLYGYVLQRMSHVPVIFPYSTFKPPDKKKEVRNMKKESFVLGRVIGKKTAYLNEDYMLVWLPNLLDHMETIGKAGLVTCTYNPLLMGNIETVFHIDFVCETVQMVPLGTRVRDVLKRLWRDMTLPKSAKKMMVNVSIGILGTKENDIDAYQKVTVLNDMEELSLLSPSMNSDKYSIVAMDEENFAIVPNSMKSAKRFQTGLLTHQLLVDTAVLMVAELAAELQKRGIEVLQINTDEVIFPQSKMHMVDDLLYDSAHNTFESNGGLKLSKTDFSMPHDIPEVMNQSLDRQRDFYLAKLEIFDRAPKTTDYIIVDKDSDLQEHPRVLLTASVPGAGKTHTVCSQDGITGVIAVPTNALAVDLKAKFPQHKVITIHKLLGRVARAFGLLDFVEEKQAEDTPEENIDEQEDVEVRKATKGVFRDGDSFLCIDEIYMLPSAVLLALYHYIQFLPEGISHVYATGDPCQLDPVEDLDRSMNSKAAREAMIVNMFPVRIHLKECRRNHTRELNEKTERFCNFLQKNKALSFSNGVIPALKSICHQNGVRIITDYQEVIHLMKTQEDMLVAAYTNKTCHEITESVLGELKGKLRVGTKLINRRRKYRRGGNWMHLNYVYEVTGYNPTQRIVQLMEEQVQNEEDDVDVDPPKFWVDEEHVLKSMHWHRTRTAHCLQGTSWNGGVIVTDTTKKHLVNRAYFYVTMTRARDFGRLYVYIPN